MVIVTFAFLPFAAFAFIITVPGLNAVTFPFSSTVAIFLLLLTHVNGISAGVIGFIVVFN